MKGPTCSTCPACDLGDAQLQRNPPARCRFNPSPMVIPNPDAFWCMEHPDRKMNPDLINSWEPGTEHLPIIEKGNRRYLGVSTEALLQCFRKSLFEVRKDEYVEGRRGSTVVALFPNTGRGISAELLLEMVAELLERGEQQAPANRPRSIPSHGWCLLDRIAERFSSAKVIPRMRTNDAYLQVEVVGRKEEDILALMADLGSLVSFLLGDGWNDGETPANPKTDEG